MVSAARARKKSARKTGVSTTKKVKDLDDSELEKLRDEIGKFIVEGDLRREVSMNIKRLMDLGLLSWPASSQGLAVPRPAYSHQCTYPQGPA